MSIATLIYEVYFIIRAACCNTNIIECGAFFKVESEVTVAAVLLLLPSSQCFACCFWHWGTSIPEPGVMPEVEEIILI